MKIKTTELTGINLDWAVAKCEGATEGWCDNAPFFDSGYPCINIDRCAENYQPSTNWTYGGPIIERENMDFEWVDATNCRASLEWLDEDFFESFGPTPLIAAMRCYVESKLGDEIDIPEELA